MTPTDAGILAILGVTYAGIAMGHFPGLKLDRTGIALLGAIAMMALCGVSTGQVVSYVDWPTIFLLFGFFVLSAQLRLSGFYSRVAAGVAARLGHPARFLLVLMAVTAALSAFLNHDIVCYAFTPIVAAALLRARRDPVPFLIALAVASNIGAAATLVGNPQNMMIGEVAHLGFGAYARFAIVPVVVALLGAYGIVLLLGRASLRMADAAEPSDGDGPDGDGPGDRAPAMRPYDRTHTIKGLIILAAVIALFFTGLPKEVVVLAAAGIHLASPKFRTADLLGLVDWTILVMFLSLFVVTGAFRSTGYGDRAVAWLAEGGFDLHAPAALASVTTVSSNVINNSAAVMLLAKVVDLSNPVTAYVLALANSFGGSLLVLGSVSNLIVVTQAREQGIEISFFDFARLGVPITLFAIASMLLWVALVT